MVDLQEFYDRCLLMDVKPILDDFWLIMKRNNEFWLDYTYFTEEIDTQSVLNRRSIWKPSMDVKEVLTVPDGITKVSAGSFNRVDCKGLRLNLNQIDRLPHTLFQGHNEIVELYCPNVRYIEISSLQYMNQLKLLDLRKLKLIDLNASYFYGIPESCRILLSDFSGYHSEYKRVRQSLSRRFQYIWQARKGK